MDLVKEMKVMDKLGIVAPGIMEKDMETQKEKITQKPPDYDTDFSGNVCVELLINAQGKAISAKSCNSTSHPDQNVIKSVVEFVKKNVKYKAEEGAPNRKAFYTVYIQAG